jgi:YaiO family outer membrane protein
VSLYAGLIPILLLAAPAHAEAQGQPADAYRAGVEARLNGNPERAVTLLEPVVAADPRNSDAQVQIGLAQLALGRLDEAEHAFRAALEVAPGYTDARVGLARVAQRRGDRAAALRELDQADSANADVASLRVQLARTEESPPWQLDIDGSYSALTGPQPDWQEASIQLRRRLDEMTTIGGRLEYARRFGKTDIYGEALLEHVFSPRARAYVTFGATADPDFRPKWQIGAGGSLRVRDGAYATVITLDGRQAQYAIGNVQSLTPGIEQYLTGRAWLTARWINLFDERGTRRTGYLVRGDLQLAPPARLFLGYSDAPDTDEGIVVDVRSIFGGLSYDVTPRTTLRVTLAHDDRATGADRTQVGLGLGFRF